MCIDLGEGRKEEKLGQGIIWFVWAGSAVLALKAKVSGFACVCCATMNV
jgi:hypothetical protein